MGLKRDLMELAVGSLGAISGKPKLTDSPQSIFVLRNNDIGDLLVATPLFEALKKRFPGSRIAAGVGSWNAEVLANNPFVDEIIPVNAPWHNQQVKPSGIWPSITYLLRSSQVEAIKRHRFDIGIDVLGSPWGSLLMMQAGIPWRLGVKGYAGGHSGVQQFVQFDSEKHVAKAALEFASLLGAQVLPQPRPQLYLTDTERTAGSEFWSKFERTEGRRRVVVAPGGGYQAKCWPAESYSALVRRMEGDHLAVIGGKADRANAEQMTRGNSHVRNVAGELSLREVFGLIASADAVICNSSMAMHVAGAFRKPSLVLLGEAFSSAKEHAQLWGYPETVMIGREAGSPEISSVDEAFAAYCKMTR